MKGISLSINTIIIVAIAILVLVFLGYTFLIGSFPPFYGMRLEQSFNSGCEKYIKTGTSPENIFVGDINSDGSNDNLLTACRMYYGIDDMNLTECENRCKQKFPFGFGASGGGGT